MATGSSAVLAGHSRSTSTKQLAKRLHIRQSLDLGHAQSGSRTAAQRSPATDARSRHEIEFRVSFPTLFWGTRYVTVFAGKERRSEERLHVEGQTHWTRRTLFFLTTLGVMSLFALFGLFCLLYLLKSVLGINLMSRPSPFHPLYSLFLAR